MGWVGEEHPHLVMEERGRERGKGKWRGREEGWEEGWEEGEGERVKRERESKTSGGGIGKEINADDNYMCMY